MNIRPTSSNKKAWSKPVWAVGGFLTGLAWGRYRKAGAIAGFVTLAGLHALKKCRKQEEPAEGPSSLETDDVEIMPAMEIVLLRGEKCTATDSLAVFPLWHEAPLGMESIEPVVALEDERTTQPTATESSPLIWEPGLEVQNISNAWSETVWFGGHEVGKIPAPVPPPVAASDPAAFDFITQMLNRASQRAMQPPDSLSTFISGEDVVTEVLTPMPGVTVPHLPFQDTAHMEEDFIERHSIAKDEGVIESGADAPFEPLHDALTALLATFHANSEASPVPFLSPAGAAGQMTSSSENSSAAETIVLSH